MPGRDLHLSWITVFMIPSRQHSSGSQTIPHSCIGQRLKVMQNSPSWNKIPGGLWSYWTIGVSGVWTMAAAQPLGEEGISPLPTHLVAEIHVGVSGEKQGDHVHVTLLGSQMHRSNALSGHSIGISTVFQQCGGYVHLVLLGSNVQRSVTVLSRQTSLVMGPFNK